MKIFEYKLVKVFALLLLIINLLFSGSCSLPVNSDLVSQSASASATAVQSSSISRFAQKNPEVSAKVDPFIYDSIEKVIDESDYIVIATVTDILPAFTVGENHEITDDFTGLGCVNYTPYIFTVEQVISGDSRVGDSIRVDLMGGEASGVTFTCSPIAYPEINTTYLVFLQDFDWVIEHDLEFNRIVFTGCYDGFYRLDGDKLFPNEHATLIPAGTMLQDVLDVVESQKVS